MHVAGGGGGSDPGFFEQIGNSLFMGSRALVNTWVNSGGAAQQASFSVDIEQIPGLIAKYEQARDEMDEILQDAQELQRIPAPGEDEVSKQMVHDLRKKAGNDPGCLSWAVNDGRQRLQDQIDQLKQARLDYQNADEAATPRIQT